MPERRDDLWESASYPAKRLGRHLRRMRHRGIATLAGEDLSRAAVRLRKLRWRLTHDCAPRAVPVFIVGLQRSGTKMLIFGLRESREVEVYNESKRSAAFRDFQLREDDRIRSLVERSAYRCVAFKALCDSHRTAHLLDGLGTASAGRAIWIYRSMEGRVRSALARFGDNNLRVLAAIASGQAAGSWHDEGLTREQRTLVGEFDYATMNPASAAALWWYVRNSLFFDLRLNEREDVALTSYDRFLSDPHGMMRSVCSFIGVSYDTRMSKGIAPRPAPSADEFDIEPAIRELCLRLERRLDAWFETHGARPPAIAAA